MLPADGIIFAMPLYFYGMPGRLKTVFDRPRSKRPAVVRLRSGRAVVRHPRHRLPAGHDPVKPGVGSRADFYT
jgi:hypothetical protein